MTDDEVVDEHPAGLSIAMGGPFLMIYGKKGGVAGTGYAETLAAYHGDRVVKVEVVSETQEKVESWIEGQTPTVMGMAAEEAVAQVGVGKR